MAQCPRMADCAFLKDELFQKMTFLIQKVQITYCNDEFVNCACYRVATSVGDEFIPSLMMPSQIEWAEQIRRDNAHALQEH